MNTISMVNAVHVEMGPTGPTMAHEDYVGRFNTYVKAEKWITTGDGYFHKGVQYNYCVIKEVTLELYPRVVREVWFKWDGYSYSYVPKPPVREIISGNSRCIGKRINGSNIE